MRIDLHTHTDRSDGTSTPSELVREAQVAGLDVLAITDHDCFEGWDEAASVAQELGLTLVRGIEISCKYAGQSVHLLGYLPDPTYPPLVEELQRVLDGRSDRLPAILDRLRELDIVIGIDDVRALSADAAAMGRPHVADALVARGVVRDRDEAFARFLSPGRPAYVDRYAADLATMIETVKGAGGVTVVAHPWGRHAHSALTFEGLAALKDAGLSGIEVDHQDHAPDVREELRGLAKELDLVVTGSSDFHGTGKTGHDLACNTTAPEEYHRLVALATETAVASGRAAPGVVS
ncbi:MAG TPA: PHP domain-containing protein [Nocardioidaceae bacterium]|nr:PHP domain-containing protein [Nocardioidaceae bacterium]